jgi:prepilin-type N-terminal cleavage/methylation domain-containing protein
MRTHSEPTHNHSESGFTLVEVLISITLLSVGVLALLDSSATVTKMLRDGRQRSRAVALATTRLELLRRQARTTSPNCSALTNGSQSYSDGYRETWTISGSGWQRAVTVAVAFPNGRQTAAQSYRTTLLCQ